MKMLAHSTLQDIDGFFAFLPMKPHMHLNASSSLQTHNKWSSALPQNALCGGLQVNGVSSFGNE